MKDEEIKKLEDYLKSLPTIKQNMSIPVTTNIGINLDDLMNAVKELKKIPTYDELLRENKKLKKQLKYITSGEYYNQLRFERNMLQDLMYNSEIPKEYKEFVDYTHRNTELLGEKQELIDYLKNHTLSEEVKEQSKDFICGYNFAIDDILSKIEKSDK